MSTVAERYAQAIFELSAEQNQVGPVSEQLSSLASAYASSRELQLALENPVIGDEQRQRVLSGIAERLGVSGLALNAAKVILTRRRMSALPEIAATLTRLSDEKEGVLRATVTSASPLPESYYQNFVAKLQGATGRRIVLEKREDASLIGGVIAQIGDSIVDGSIRGRLAELERDLLTGVGAPH